ncbi:MAG: RNA 3'-terminal phosphate cyclase [Halobacteria archaeon]
MNIDGSMGEGGGQIVRTSVALAAATGTEIRIENVRAERDPPGLKNQHLAAVEAVAEICDAETEGVEKGSREFRFDPEEPTGGRYEVDVCTAGSVNLIAQTVLLAAHGIDEKLVVEIEGGTDVRWSPTYDYISGVFLPLARRTGLHTEYELEQRGHYPEGGGKVVLTVEPVEETKPLELRERGEIESVAIEAHVSNLPEDITEREVASARQAIEERLPLSDIPVETRRTEEEAISKGTSVTAGIEFRETVLGGTCVGKIGKPAEKVGREAADPVVEAFQADATVDRHAADQLTPFVALHGGGYIAPELTSHLETVVRVCRKFGLGIGCSEGERVEVNSTSSPS